MNRREKMLALGFAAAILIWQGSSVMNWLVFEPLARRAQQKESLETAIRAKSLEKAKQMKAAQNLGKWKSRSLPPDPVKAATEYNEWLIEQAGKAKLSEVKVTIKKSAFRPEADGTWHRIEAGVEAQGTLDKVCDFLYALEQSHLLHKVKKITLEATKHTSNPPLEKVEIQLEALALRDAPPRNTLLADPQNPPKPESIRDRKEYAAITDRNLFVKTYNGPPKPRPTRPNPTPADDLDQAEVIFLTFVGLRQPGDHPEGWLYDRSTNERTDLRLNSTFKVAGLTGKTVSFGTRHVVFEIDGTKWRLDLGENLRQMKKAAERETALQQ